MIPTDSLMVPEDLFARSEALRLNPPQRLNLLLQAAEPYWRVAQVEQGHQKSRANFMLPHHQHCANSNTF
jgi:hypothetical protein